MRSTASSSTARGRVASIRTRSRIRQRDGPALLPSTARPKSAGRLAPVSKRLSPKLDSTGRISFHRFLACRLLGACSYRTAGTTVTPNISAALSEHRARRHQFQIRALVMERRAMKQLCASGLSSRLLARRAALIASGSMACGASRAEAPADVAGLPHHGRIAGRFGRAPRALCGTAPPPEPAAPLQLNSTVSRVPTAAPSARR